VYRRRPAPSLHACLCLGSRAVLRLLCAKYVPNVAERGACAQVTALRGRVCDTFPQGFKGAPSGRQAHRPWGMFAEDARDVHGEAVNEPRECRAVSGQGDRESRRKWRAAWPAASSAGAHRRGPGCPPRRYAAPDHSAHPAVTYRGWPRRASWPGCRLAPGVRSPGERSQASGRNAAHCPGRPLQRQRCSASALHATRVPGPTALTVVRSPPAKAQGAQGGGSPPSIHLVCHADAS